MNATPSDLAPSPLPESPLDPAPGTVRGDSPAGLDAGTLPDDAPDVPMIAKRYAGDYYGDATYDPRDNKLRIYPFARLPRDVYERVRAAGFAWAPKQELFVAPAWTPEREDFALELCGDIDDESTTPAERAAARAERFDGYRENRERDTARAVAYVDSIAEGIPLGQPILVGHHSERHARRDAKRIESGMRRAVENWGKAEYWRGRVPAVLAHADYREAPGVRSRRIKGLAAELRKVDERLAAIERIAGRWRAIGLGASFLSRTVDGVKQDATPHECARWLVGHTSESGLEYSKWSKGLDDGTLTVDAAVKEALDNLTGMQARSNRWASHLRNRIAFETAALALEEGRDPDAPAPSAVPYAVGGSVVTRAGGRRVNQEGAAVRRRILRVTKRNGAVLSLVLEGLRDAVAVEACADYREPTADDAKAAKARTALPPLCNYPAERIVCPSRYHRDQVDTLAVEEWTAEEYAKLHRDYKGTRHVEATATHGAHRVRSAISNRKREPGQYGGRLVAVFIVDQKRTDPPAKAPPPPAPKERTEDMDAKESEPLDLPKPEDAKPYNGEDMIGDDTPVEQLRAEYGARVDVPPLPLPVQPSHLPPADYRDEGKTAAACAERFDNEERFRGLPAMPRYFEGSEGKPDPDEGRDDFREGLAERVDQMRASLAGGVRTVSAPNLFPTPPEVAREMVRRARLYDAPADLRVLEPSAGTGRLLDAMREEWPKWSPSWTVHAVEINRELAGQLQARFPGVTVHGADFLSFAAGEDCDGGAFAPFDRVLMNPPFDHGNDVEHVRHALHFLKPGGILVGICANGPKQERELEPMTDYWEELPSGTFAGTKVGAVLFRVTLGADGKPVPA